MNGLKQTCVDYALGTLQTHKNLTVVPIKAKRGGKKSQLDYIVLSEGMEKGVVDIRETGDVNKLWLSNNSDKDLLVMKGEYFVGGKQNRMVTVNGLIAAHTGRMYIPVHCVQYGRWDAPKGFGLAKQAVSVKLRSSVRKSFSGQGGQSETWSSVNELLSESGVRSSSDNYDEAHQARKGDIDDYVNAFQKQSGQIGVVAFVQGRDGRSEFYIDMFDQANTFGKHYERLFASYAMEAVAKSGTMRPNPRSNPQPVSADMAQDILERALAGETTESQSISLGTDHEFTNMNVMGSALEYDGTLIYLGAKNAPIMTRESKDPRDRVMAARRGII